MSRPGATWRFLRLALLVAGPGALMGLPLPRAPWRSDAAPTDLALIALASALTLAWVVLLSIGRAQDDRFARRRPWLLWPLLLAASAAVTFSLLGENLRTQWRVIDDHDYVQIIGPTGRLTTQRWLHTLATFPEVGGVSWSVPRYRPVFWAWRITEMRLWGARPELFWAAKLAMFAAAMTLGWFALWTWLGGVASGLVLAWLLTWGYWVDVWCRLGCSEAHGALGAAMLAAGAALVSLDLRRAPARPSVGTRRRWSANCNWPLGWFLAAGGAILAGGSKENFLALTPLVWLLMFWASRRRRLGVAGWAAGIASTAVAGFIAAVILAGVLTRQTDFYQNPVSAGQRAAVLLGWVASDFGRWWTPLAATGLVAAVTTWTLARKPSPGRPGPRRRAALLAPAVLLLACVALLASQVVFYNGRFPTAIRYDFPGLPAAILAGVALAQLLLLAWRAFAPAAPASSFLAHAPAQVRAAALALIGLAALALGFAPLRQGSAMNVAESVAFTERFTKAAQRLSAAPAVPVVFVAYHPDNAELATSILRFLRFRGSVNPAFLAPRIDPATLTDPLAQHMTRLMERDAEQGGSGFNPWRQYDPRRWPMVFAVLLDFDGRVEGLPAAGLDPARQRVDVVMQMGRGGQMPIRR